MEGRVLLLGDSHLAIDFCTRKACPGKLELCRGLKHIVELHRKLKGVVVFCHVGHGNKQLADWLTHIAKELGRSVAVEHRLPNDLTLFAGPVWDPKNLSEHVQGC